MSEVSMQLMLQDFWAGAPRRVRLPAASVSSPTLELRLELRLLDSSAAASAGGASAEDCLAPAARASWARSCSLMRAIAWSTWRCRSSSRFRAASCAASRSLSLSSCSLRCSCCFASRSLIACSWARCRSCCFARRSACRSRRSRWRRARSSRTACFLRMVLSAAACLSWDSSARSMLLLFWEPAMLSTDCACACWASASLTALLSAACCSCSAGASTAGSGCSAAGPCSCVAGGSRAGPGSSASGSCSAGAWTAGPGRPAAGSCLS
mmetsp:Transcript_97231/g.275072  ORF Transcript_97231/g.275072 Transcript_97231/m.275072 type:complete len:267 (+) Transcript_97231:1477-2277(+)